MASIILPYPNLGETLGVALDLSKIPHTTTGLHSVLVTDASKLGKNASIGINVQVPSGIADNFPPSERKSPPLDVLATAISIDGSLREAVSLKRQKANLYSGTINLDLTRIKESVRINVYAVRTVRCSAGGFAREKGSRLAWAPEHEIRLLERPVKGNFLRVLWEDFSDSAVVPPHYEDAMHYVDAASEPPVIYLNKKTTAPLIKLVDTQGHGHPKAFPRDLVHRTIGVDAWLTLAHLALKTLHDEASEAGGPIGLEEALGGTWKKDVVELLLPALYPNLDPEDAVEELCANIGTKLEYERAVLRVTLGIQEFHDIKLKEIYEKFAEETFKHA